jgi:hypothetical protein
MGNLCLEYQISIPLGSKDIGQDLRTDDTNKLFSKIMKITTEVLRFQNQGVNTLWSKKLSGALSIYIFLSLSLFGKHGPTMEIGHDLV